MRVTEIFPKFSDIDGSPLDAGYLYFGVAGKNPETDPVALYWDAALTQPAAQPIRTTNGYIFRDGSIANVYCASSSYSVTAKNKRNVLLFSLLTADSSDLAGIYSQATGSFQIGHIAAAVGAVFRTVQSKLRDTLNVMDFGADPTGVNDSTLAINYGISALVALGGGTLKFPAGDFKVTSTILVNSSYIFFQGEGGALDGNQPFVDSWANIIAKAATRWFWGAAANAGPMLLISPDDVVAPVSSPLLGGGFDGIMFDSANLCGTGVKIISTRGANYTNSSVVRHTTWGMILGTTVNDLYNEGYGTNVSLSLCKFENICVSTAKLPGNTAKACLMYGTGMKGNVCQNMFINMQWYCSDYSANCVEVELTDDNYFAHCRWTGRFRLHAGDTGTMPATTGFPGSLAQNNFFFFPLGNFDVLKGAEATGTGWVASTAGITAGMYRWYGFNKYQATTSGTTGTIPPTHITGTVSDGGVSWLYVKNNTPSFGHGCYGHSGNLIDGLSLIQKINIEKGADFSVFGSCINYSNNKGFVSWGLKPAITTLYLSADQTGIVSTVTTPVSWNLSDDDILDAWNIAAPTNLVVPNNVKYVSLTFVGKWDNNGVGQRYAGIYLNGAPIAETETFSTGLSPFSVSTGPFAVNPGDVITAKVQQQSGANRALIGVSTRLIAEWR